MQRFRIIQLFMAFITLFSVLMPNLSSVQASTGVGSQIFDTTSTSTRFIDVVVGDNHSCGLKANGTVMCWGYNGEGQLGIGDWFSRYSLVPLDVPGVTNAVAIAAGSNNTCVILRDGSLSCWGYGYFGDGNGLYVRWSAGVIPGMRDVTQIAMSNRGSCIYTKNSQFICWGDNYTGYYGEYWMANNYDRETLWPRLLYTDSYTTIAVRNVDRNRRVCVQRVDGRVACVGINTDGALGLGFTSTNNYNGYSVVGLGNFVRKFAMGANGGCAILTDKTVSCWGSFAGAYESTARNIP
ncbi:MAG: RCC1 domain-containing protein, partial [Roseiflexaceae bacterium]